MDSSTIVLLATVVIVVLAAVFVFTTSARRDRSSALERELAREERELVSVGAHVSTGREIERAAAVERQGADVALSASGGPPAVRAPMDPEILAVTRRQFLNRSIVNFFGLGLAGFGAASIGFLWPVLSGGFGSKIRVGSITDILGQIESKREPFYLAEGRTWIAPFPEAALGKARASYSGGVLTGMEGGVVALYQKCVHLGCRVPWCKSAQWFECPCHGSRYNRVGEKKGGPAPRGLDRFAAEVTGGILFVDTKKVIQGPPIGVNTTGQEAEGPHCA